MRKIYTHLERDGGSAEARERGQNREMEEKRRGGRMNERKRDKNRKK